jgi:hypothetical protein
MDCSQIAVVKVVLLDLILAFAIQRWEIEVK